LRSDFYPIFVWYNNGKRLYPTPATLDFTGEFGFSLIIPYGEVLGLKWSHINFESNTVTVQDTVVRCGNTKAIDKPRTKNKASHRTLPLIAPLREYLLSLRQKQDANRKLLGSEYADNDYVCTWNNGAAFKPNYISCRFGIVIRKASLPHLRFHDLRHSAASMLLELKFSLKEIQEYLGHGTLSTTANIYAHLQYKAKEDMAVSLGNQIAI